MRRTMISLAMSSVVVLAACGGGDGGDDTSGSGSNGEGGLTPISVGAIPIADVAPLYLGIQEGIFEDAGLDVEPFLVQGGAAIVPAVINGEAQFGFSNMTTLLQAEAQGVPLALVAPGPGATGDPDNDYGALIVAGDSSFQTAADLASSRIAINTLNNISDTVVRESVRKAGGDPADIEFVEIPVPDMVNAVASGQVDAAFAVEPFVTLGGSQGLRSIAAPYTDTDPDLTVAGYFTSDQYQAENPDVVQAFADAMSEAQTYAQEHPDETREILGTYTQVPEEVRAELTLPKFQSEINRESVARLLELGVQDGIIPEDAVDLDNVFAPLD